MKLYIMILLGAFAFSSLKSSAEKSNMAELFPNNFIMPADTMPPDSLRTYMTNLKVSLYYSMPVDSFLAAIPNSPLGMFVSSCQLGKKSMYEACYLQVVYYAGMTIRIYVKDFTHLPKYSSNLSWNINLFRKEKIYRISIYKDDKCVNGFCKIAN